MTCCNPFTGKCEGGHGCAAHTESVCPPCTHDCTQDDSNHPWEDIDRIESTVIWIIVWLCAGLVSYLGFLAWRLI